jgi:flagellar basal-body rod protein FlgF
VNRIGRIKLVNPPEAQLERGADGLFRARAGEVAPADNEVALAGGHLESSNVNVVEEMVSLISLSRQFEMQIQMLRNAEENDRAGGQLLSNR